LTPLRNIRNQDGESARSAGKAASAPNLISVIVATYNRAASLPDCLKSLMAARLPPDVACEVICVDNNSTDRTKDAVQELARVSPIPIEYLFEPVQGISPARNAGLRHARGRIIALTDDDCIVDPEWLASIWKEFEAAPTLDLIGGRVELYNKDDLPMTIRTSRERKVYEAEPVMSEITGCNFAFRRELVDEIGMFDPLFGAGGRIPAGEDTDFYYRAFRAGRKIVYSPDVLVYHNHGRRTERDRRKLLRSYLISDGAIYIKYILKNDRHAWRAAYWTIFRSLRGALRKTLRLQSSGEEWRRVGHYLNGFFRYGVIWLARLGRAER